MIWAQVAQLTSISYPRSSVSICGLFLRLPAYRFVVTGIAANPGPPTSPRIATEHFHPTLAGQPPLSTAPLPEQEPDPTPPIKLPAD